MKVAYADPPYLGCCSLYGHEHGRDGWCWDHVATHNRLIRRLEYEYQDGWALSCSSTSLRSILPLCPEGVRVSAWVKPFAVFKPNVNPAYAWEPVIWFGGRGNRSRNEPTMMDWVSSEVELKKGLIGAKPEKFCWWLLNLLGLQVGDELVDLFPSTGIMTEVWGRFQNQRLLFKREG